MRFWFGNPAARWQLLLVIVDVLLLVGCVHAAEIVRFWVHFDVHTWFAAGMRWRVWVVAGVLIFAMAALGLYDRHLPVGWLGRLTRQGVAFLLGAVLLSVLYYAVPATFLGRGVLGIALILGYGAVAVWRVVFARLVDADLFKRRIVLLGAGKRAAEVSRRMPSRADRRGFKVLGYIPAGDEPVAVPVEVLLHPRGSWAEWALAQGVDEIVVGPDDRRGTLPLDALLECKQRGILVVELAEFFEREAGAIKIDLASASWLVFSSGFDSSPARRCVKRAFDVAVAALAMLFACPLMLLTAMAIRLESGRGAPILYRQDRVGENGKTFAVIKFRSMRVDAERNGVAQWATRNDARVTRVGRVIRKARLDELPQLWNVLRGDMSVIGPRPERPQFVGQLQQRVPYYALRHTIKPGLTGWAQLRYPYGASFEDAEEKLRFDLFYVKHHNFAFDLIILIQTVEVVLFGRGAR